MSTAPVSAEAYEPPPHGFRTFLIVWATQSVSVLGSGLTFFAITIWLTQVLYPLPSQKPQLAFALALISIVAGGVAIFSAPLAGAWADRHDRKRTMMAMDFVSGVVSLVLALLITENLLQFWMIIILLPIAAFAGAYHASAFDTSYAMIVPEKQLPRANGMMQTVWAFSAIASPALAAFLISLPGLARQGFVPGVLGEALRGYRDGTALAIMLDAITFFIASATLIFLFIPSPRRADLHEVAPGAKKPSVWSDVRLGGTYIRRRPPLLWLLATFTVINFAASPIEVFIPLLLKFNLSLNWHALGWSFETSLAALSIASGFGGLAGGIFISAWGGLKRRRVYGVVVPILLAGIAQVVFGLSAVVYLSLVCCFALAFLMPMMNAHSQTIWQTQTPRELQGRVFAVRRLIAQFSAPLGVFLAGIVGGLFDPGMVIAALGVVIVAFAAGQLFNPVLLRVEDKAYLDSLAGEAPEPAAMPAEAVPETADAGEHVRERLNYLAETAPER